MTMILLKIEELSGAHVPASVDVVEQTADRVLTAVSPAVESRRHRG
jgi:hypothetical protein